MLTYGEKDAACELLTSEHTLVDNTVTTQQESVAGELGQIWIANFVDIAGYQFTRRNVSPLHVSDSSVGTTLRAKLTKSVAKDANVAFEPRYFSKTFHGLRK